MRGAFWALVFCALAACGRYNESAGRGGVQGRHPETDQRPDDHNNDGVPDYLEGGAKEGAPPP